MLFTRNISWSAAKSKLVAQAKKSIYAIKHYQRHFGKFEFQDYFKMFDSMVKRILLCASPIWGTEYSEEI